MLKMPLRAIGSVVQSIEGSHLFAELVPCREEFSTFRTPDAEKFGSSEWRLGLRQVAQGLHRAHMLHG